MIRTVASALALSLTLTTNVYAKPVDTCELNQISYWEYKVNRLSTSQGYEKIPLDPAISEVAKVIYDNGLVIPEEYRNLSIYARTFFNERDIYQKYCLAAHILPKDMTTSEIEGWIQSLTRGAYSFGFYTGETATVIIFMG